MNKKALNGGALNVAEGGYARFLSDARMANIKILSVTDEGSDVSPDTWYGGCIYNQVWRVYGSEFAFYATSDLTCFGDLD